MKRLALFLMGLTGAALASAFAGDMPRGRLLELHSCEVYAGGCVVSSEATLGGRSMLRVWDFTAGSFSGAELRGLQLAVLQSSPDNLAVPESRSGDAVVYLPQAATQAQRDALLAWLKSSQPDFQPAKAQTRVAALRFLRSPTGCTFSAENLISVETAPVERCSAFACGESLWYQPRSVAGVFTVAVDRASRVAEPLLKLKWDDAGKRSVFLARFGGSNDGKNLYVSQSELCGPDKTLF